MLRRNFEYRTYTECAATAGSAEEVSCGVLHDRVGTASQIAGGAITQESMNHVHASGRSQVVQNTRVRFPPKGRYAIQVSVAALNRSGFWPLAVCAVGGRAEVMH